MFIALMIAAALPAMQQATTPEQMLRQVNRDTPEDEEQAAIRAAEQHPLGTLANPIRVGGPEGEHAYLGRLRCPDGNTPQLGAPSGFTLHVRDILPSAGAGFVVALAGDIMTMPGLGKSPGAERIRLNPDGTIEGLF